MTLLEELKHLYDALPQGKRQAVSNAIRSCPDCGGNCDDILEALTRELKRESKAQES